MFHTIFYEPIYNLLVFFLNVIPLHDVGASIVLVTCVVKGILFPLNVSAVRGQHALKKVEGEIKKVRELHKNDPQTSGTKMMEIYKREKINPLTSIITMALQIPVFIALYLVFSKGIHVDTNSLYSFISFPENLQTEAFGILDVTKKNILVGILTGISAFILAKRQASNLDIKEDKHKKGEPSFQESFQQSLKIQILYVFPVIILFTASVLPSAIGVYWITSNILGVAQDFYIKKKYINNKAS